MVTLILINSYFRAYVLGVIALLGSGFKCPGDHRLHVGKRKKNNKRLCGGVRYSVMSGAGTRDFDKWEEP